MIADASITSAKIVSLDAGKITAGTMSADRISGGTINGVVINAKDALSVSSNIWNNGTSYGLSFGTTLASYSEPATIKYLQGIAGDGTSSLDITVGGGASVSINNALTIYLKSSTSVTGKLTTSDEIKISKVDGYITSYNPTTKNQVSLHTNIDKAWIHFFSNGSVVSGVQLNSDNTITVSGINASYLSTSAGHNTLLYNVGSSWAYNAGQLELQCSDGGNVILGFHRAGYTAVELIHNNSGGLLLWTASATWGDFYCGRLQACSSTYPNIYGDGLVLQFSYSSASTTGVVLQAGTMRPSTDGSLALGQPSWRWGQIFSTNSAISTSDRNEKNTIESLGVEKTTNFIMALNPVSYKFNTGESDRLHYGLISQDVEDALDMLGMTSLDFAGFIKSPVGDKFVYGLRYEEFIAPLIKVVQNLVKKNEELENKITAMCA